MSTALSLRRSLIINYSKVFLGLFENSLKVQEEKRSDIELLEVTFRVLELCHFDAHRSYIAVKCTS